MEEFDIAGDHYKLHDSGKWYITNGMDGRSCTHEELIEMLKDERKDHAMAMCKIEGIIGKLDVQPYMEVLNKKSFMEILDLIKENKLNRSRLGDICVFLKHNCSRNFEGRETLLKVCDIAQSGYNYDIETDKFTL